MIKQLICTAMLMGVMVSAEAKTVLIDLRTPPEIAVTGKVEGAQVANYTSPSFMDQFKATGAETNDEIELYCRSGARAASAKAKLEALGYKNVKNLGGYESAAETLHRPLVK